MSMKKAQILAILLLATTALAGTAAAESSIRIELDPADAAGSLVIAQEAAAASGSTIAMSGAGHQNSSLRVEGASRVDFAFESAAPGTEARMVLRDVAGAGGGAGVVRVTQTTNAAGASIDLVVAGGGYAPGGAGIVVAQNSPGAVLAATINAGGSGYTVNISQ
jgi:hypothetical protein